MFINLLFFEHALRFRYKNSKSLLFIHFSFLYALVVLLTYKHFEKYEII